MVEEWSLDLKRIARWTTAGWKWLIALTIVGSGLGMAYGMLAPQRFTATTDILIDPANLVIVPDDIYSQSAAQDSQLLDVESKIRILTSGRVLAQVVEKLGLQNDPEFISSKVDADSALIAQRSLAEHIRARREERSYVVSVSVWAETPQKSVDISNTLVTTFMQELATGESDGAERSARSLMSRLDELRLSVNEAEEKVEAFRNEHGLQTSDGELVSSRSLTVSTTQLLEAQQRLLQAQSRYDDLASGKFVGDSSDAQQSPTMTAWCWARCLITSIPARSKAASIHPARCASASIFLRTFVRADLVQT